MLDGAHLRWLLSSPMLRPTVPSLLVLSVVLALPARAGDLPPTESPAYSAVYKTTSRFRDKAQDEWGPAVEDTVTIAAATKQSRWDYKSDGHTILNDQVGRYSTIFGGKTPPNTALRSKAPFVPIGWEFGYGTVVKVTENPTEVLGKATIAGKECTRIHLSSDQYGEPEYCVTSTGIVLRFANRSGTAETVYEAQSVDETAPDQKIFSVPAGITVEERGGPRRPKIL